MFRSFWYHCYFLFTHALYNRIVIDEVLWHGNCAIPKKYLRYLGGNLYIGNINREASKRGTNSEKYVAASKWQILNSFKNISNSNQNKTDSINKTSPAAMLKMYSIRKYSFLKDHGYIEPFTQSNNGNNWEHFPSRNDIVLTINKNTPLPSNNPSDYLLKVIWKSSVLV